MPIQIDQANFAGAVKYRKGRRLAGDVNDENDDELPDWTSDDEDEDENDPDYEHV